MEPVVIKAEGTEYQGLFRKPLDGSERLCYVVIDCGADPLKQVLPSILRFILETTTLGARIIAFDPSITAPTDFGGIKWETCADDKTWVCLNMIFELHTREFDYLVDTEQLVPVYYHMQSIGGLMVMGDLTGSTLLLDMWGNLGCLQDETARIMCGSKTIDLTSPPWSFEIVKHLHKLEITTPLTVNTGLLDKPTTAILDSDFKLAQDLFKEFTEEANMIKETRLFEMKNMFPLFLDWDKKKVENLSKETQARLEVLGAEKKDGKLIRTPAQCLRVVWQDYCGHVQDVMKKCCEILHSIGSEDALSRVKFNASRIGDVFVSMADNATEIKYTENTVAKLFGFIQTFYEESVEEIRPRIKAPVNTVEKRENCEKSEESPKRQKS